MTPYIDRESFGPQTTTDSFAELGVYTCANVLSKSIALRETGGASGIDYRILGSVDGGQNYDETVVADTNLAAGASTIQHIADYFTHLKVEIKAASAGSQGDVEADAAGIAA